MGDRDRETKVTFSREEELALGAEAKMVDSATVTVGGGGGGGGGGGAEESEHSISAEDAGELLEAVSKETFDESTLPSDPTAAFQILQQRVEESRGWAPVKGDFLSNYAASEVFVIDGDSLLGHFFESPLLAWSLDSSQQKPGAQFLHLFFAIESFLSGLIDRGAAFRIVFFESAQGIWSGSKALARKIFFLHLTKNLPHIPVDVLPGTFQTSQKEWQDYLELHKLVFILLKYSWKISEEVSNLEAEALNFGLSLGLLHQSLGVVFIDEISFIGSRSAAFYLTPRGKQLQPLAIKFLPILERLFDQPLLAKVEEQKAKTVLSQEEITNLKEKFGGDLRECLSTAGLQVLLKTDSSEAYLDIAKVYLLHLSLLEQLPLSSRVHLYPSTLPNSQLLQQTGGFLKKLFSAINDVFSLLVDASAKTERLLDLADGRLVFTSLLLLPEFTSQPSSKLLGDRTEAVWEYIRANVPALEKTTSFSLPSLSSEESAILKGAAEDMKKNATGASNFTPSAVALSCPLMEQLLDNAMSSMKQFDVEREEPEPELSGWRNIGADDWADSEAFPLSLFEQQKDLSRKKQLRNEQVAERTSKAFIDSLLVDSPVKRQLVFEDTSDEREKKKEIAKAVLNGTATRDELVSSSSSVGSNDKGKNGDEEETEDEEEPTGKGKKAAKGKATKAPKAKGKGGKAKAVSKKEQIIAQNMKRQAASEVNVLENRLKNLINQYKGDPTFVSKLLEFSKNSDNDAVSISAEMEILREHFKKWKSALSALEKAEKVAKSEGRKSSKEIVAQRRKKGQARKLIFTGLQNLLRRFYPRGVLSRENIEDLAYLANQIEFYDFAMAIDALVPNPKAKAKAKKSRVPDQNVSAIRYQLQVVGPNLARQTRSRPDSRVPFPPDEWQERLLDIVDANESAIICAPTSSGKTFISFYVMESILRADMDGVVVYVSPTKALVNQVGAEVSARFAKNYPSNSGRTVVGYYTKDYEKNTTNAQVVITVPQSLELLLLSMKESKWVHRLKYVIFDEVHCIGAEGGDVWESLLLMVPCPILALSATISNSRDFYGWLSKIETARNNRIHLIQYNQRYNDLQPFIYHSESKALVSIHPVWALNVQACIKSGQLPEDLKFLPEHCVELFDALDEHLGDEVSFLDPDEYFSSHPQKTWNISMTDAAKYEASIKEFFAKLLLEKPALAQEIIQELGAKAEKGFEEQAQKVIDRDNVVEEMLTLLRKLQAEDMLPTIVFHLNRSGCEYLAIKIFETLCQQEKLKQEEEGVSQRLVQLWKELEVEKKALERATRDLKEDEKVSQQIEDKQEQYAAKMNEYNRLLDIDRRFAFVPKEGAISKEELATFLRVKPKDVDKHNMYAALRRGIAFHHPGAPKRYRQAVERLFRMKKLRVVFSTSTLALGINMPCKSVVFATDSPELSSLNFKQMSGRAGRRGFDLRGNIIFFDVPATKVKRLMNSRLPQLLGNALVTNSAVLRIQARYDKEFEDPQTPTFVDEDRALVAAAAKRLLEYPLFQLSRADPAYSKHQYRLCLELLMQEGYISSDGTMGGFAGLATHLFFMDPLNLIVLNLIKEGLIEELAQENVSEDNKVVTLLNVMCRIFCRLPIHLSKIRTAGTTRIALPPLSEKFRTAILKYNSRILDVATHYVRTYARAYREKWGEENELPLSKQKFSVSAGDSNEFAILVKSYAAPFDARSSFVALSGLVDAYESRSELVDTVRSPITFFATQLPTLDLDAEQLNSYILDFVTYQKMSSLRANMVPTDVLWDNLKDFAVTVRLFSKALERRVKEKEDPEGKAARLFSLLFDRFPTTRLLHV